MNTKDAEALLKQAEHLGETRHMTTTAASGVEECAACNAALAATGAISNLAPDTLAVAIKLAEAAEHSANEDCSCKARPALAEWKKL